MENCVLGIFAVKCDSRYFLHGGEMMKDWLNSPDLDFFKPTEELDTNILRNLEPKIFIGVWIHISLFPQGNFCVKSKKGSIQNKTSVTLRFFVVWLLDTFSSFTKF